MFNFQIIGLIHLLWMLDFFEKSPLTPRPAPIGATGVARLAPFLFGELSEIDKLNAKEIIQQAKALADRLDLRSTNHRVSTFEMKLRFNIKGDDYINEIKVLREALKHDLSECMFYHYPREKVSVLKKHNKDWKQIAEAFPPVHSKSAAAYDCYGLGHNTASVFHIMRAAEHGLRAVAKERRIQLPRNKHIDWATWQEVITELGNEVTRIGTKASAGTAKDNALSFYSGAIADLNAFKDEYRNQVMHVRKEYDEHQALRALIKVHAFLERISEKMNYKHNRIRWGLKFRKP